MSLIPASALSELRALYSQPHRHYHTLSHVNALISLLDRYRSHFSDPQAVEAAIWFHDAVYNPRSKGYDNEIQSAELAVECLRECGVDEDRVQRVKAMIEATGSHKLASDLALIGVKDGLDVETSGFDQGSENASALNDMALFLDMDLSILGGDAKDFDEYEEAVRKEYVWMDDEGWREGRAEVLKGLLLSSSGAGGGVESENQKTCIFHTILFRQLLEEKAVGNIQRSLERLGNE